MSEKIEAMLHEVMFLLQKIYRIVERIEPSKTSDTENKTRKKKVEEKRSEMSSPAPVAPNVSRWFVFQLNSGCSR